MANRVDDDDDDDDFNDDEVVDDWLPEEEPEVEQPKPPPKIDTKPKIDIVQKSKYIVDNVDLYYALCEVEDWEFGEKDDAEQESIMKTIVVEEYKAGQNVIVEGDGGNEFYIVIATEKTAHLAEIEVVNGNLLAGTEVFLTRLHRGQYFGQKYFITRRSVKRGATCRVPLDSPCVVHIAKVCSEHFEKKHWSDFRNILLGRSVPLIQGLPRKERIQILQSLTIKEFKDREYIIKQGEKGEECYIIQEGAVKIVETRQDRGQPPQDHYLVTLREGHLFGEMSLVTDEPRVASVISIKTTICLCLTKQVFRGALSDKTFDTFMNEQLKKRKEIRDKREKDAAEEPPPASPAALGAGGRPAPSRRFSYRRKSSISVANEVKEVGTLNVRKLESGTKIINKYIIDRVLGKGAFGEVFLCIDEETEMKYAMKQINRPQNRWNEDEANSIKQEIAVMKRMKHANIVELHEVIDDMNARKIYLIQEFMEGGALMPDAETCTPISVTLARKYFRDILRGVCYLHSEGIIHRDIKPQNMLLTGGGMVKIADFGAAAFTEGNASEKVAFGGTPAFMAPELFLSNTAIDFTKVEGIDVFALGATLYYLIVGRPPWMANNQIDLATKIKNIELTFPNDIIDPHLKHLLRQMLAKDYRTRCNLDSVVVDDWVTFEGSEPLFEEAEDTFGSNYNDFNCISEDGFDVLKALIIDDSISKRTMLIQQLNVNRHVMCKSCPNNDEAIDIMTAATTNCPRDNFDFICCELVPTGQPGSDTIQQIRNLGYSGRIIGLAKTGEDVSQYMHHGAHKILRRPISNKEILILLADLDMLNDATVQASQNSPDKVSQEEVDSAIVSMGKVRTQSIRSVNFPGVDNDDDDSDNEESRSSAATLQDFQNFRSKSTRNVHGFDDPDASRNSIVESKGLSRKRGFMVVPYGGVAATSSGSDCEGDRIVFDKPLKTFSINSPEDRRRERREAAMKRSQLAQQYRTAIKNGGPDKENAKSMMHMLKLQSRKSMLQRRNSKGSNENSTSSAEERLMHMKSTHIPPSHLATAKSAKNFTLPNIDSFIINQVPGEYQEDEDFGINGDDLMDEDSDSDHDDDDDSLVDIDKDEDDDEDDGGDIGLGGDEIIQMGDVDLDDMFKELMEKKPVDETLEIQQWNHIKVGSILKTPLICHRDGWDAKLGVRYGKHDSIVARSYMEDRTYGNPCEPREGQRCPLAMFSVFDGHNGDAVAIELQMKYADRFRHFLETFESKQDFSRHDSTYETKIQQVFEDTCSSLDLDILSRDYARQQKNLRAGIQDIQNYAGSVGVTLAVMPALSKSFSSASFAPPSIQVFVSHVGDCRAVLSVDGVAEQLTEDHKANNKAEKLRVEKAGGWVSGGRVNGTLGVSRSFGDIQFKNYDPSLTSAYGADGESGIWGKGQQVISKPEFRTFVVEPSYEFIIIASDGLWDVFNCQEAVNFVRQQLSATRDLNKAAHELINKAVSRGTQDNTSVLIVAFHQYV